MTDKEKQLLKKYIILGLRTLNKQNYLEGLPDPDDQEEQAAFDRSFRVIGRYIASGDLTEIKEILEY